MIYGLLQYGAISQKKFRLEKERKRGGHSGETEEMSQSLRKKQAAKTERSWGYHKRRKCTMRNG